jgi:hypothetical protein
MQHDEAVLDGVLAWADRGTMPRKFDATFVLSLKKHLGTHGHLTHAQRRALSNIIRGFRIPVPCPLVHH